MRKRNVQTNIRMTEDEILVFNNAMVESYLIEGSKLYAATYVNPGIQKAAAQTYPLSGEAWDLIKVDSNITVKARESLIDKHNKTAGVRKSITNAKTKAMQENGLDRVYQAVNKEITEIEKELETDVKKGLTNEQVSSKREKYGLNQFFFVITNG